MKKILKVAVLVLVACSFGAIHAFAKPVETPVVFKKGTYGTEVKGNFKGYDDARYTVRAQRGQILKFNILSTRDLAYVNVYAPGDKPGKQKQSILVQHHQTLQVKLFCLKLVFILFKFIK